MVLNKFCSKEWCDFVEYHSKVINLKKGDIIFKTGDATKGIFTILEGNVKVTTRFGENNERIIRLATKDDFIGHRGFGGDWKYTVSAYCLTNVKLLFIPMNIFNTLVKSNPDFAYFMIIFFAEELRASESFASTLPIKNIVASVLLENYKVFGPDDKNPAKMAFTLSRKDMANIAGTRYETLVRTLTEFKTAEIIQTKGKEIYILDLEKLKELAITYNTIT